MELIHYDVTVKAIQARRVAVASGEVTAFSEIGELLGRLYPRLYAAVARHGITALEPSYAIYEHPDDASAAVRVTAAVSVPDDATIDADGVTTIELPFAARAATTIVRGSPDGFHDAFQALHDWVTSSGEQDTGVDREVYLDARGSRESWITELQVILNSRATESHP
jgi:effector-binding domain-containing protein